MLGVPRCDLRRSAQQRFMELARGANRGRSSKRRDRGHCHVRYTAARAHGSASGPVHGPVRGPVAAVGCRLRGSHSVSRPPFHRRRARAAHPDSPPGRHDGIESDAIRVVSGNKSINHTTRNERDSIWIHGVSIVCKSRRRCLRARSGGTAATRTRVTPARRGDAGTRRARAPRGTPTGPSGPAR